MDRVGVEDSFFDLGGHSLLLAQVHGRLVEALGRPLPLVKLFEHPTIRSLARHLEGHFDGRRPAAGPRRRSCAPAVRGSAAAPSLPDPTTQGGTSDVR